MKTAYALLLDRCGLSSKEAATFHDASLDTVKSWSSGRNAAPENAVEDLRDLYITIQEMAYDAIDMIDQQNPEAVELEMARDDKEAQELGLPCVGAHLAALGIVTALCGRPVIMARTVAND